VTPAASGDTGLIFRVTRPSLGDNAFDGYYVGVSPTDGQIVLGKGSAADNSWTPLAHTGLAVKAGAPIHIRVAATGANIRIFVGDAAAPALSVTDNTFGHGAIGVRRYAIGQRITRASFTNLSVTSQQ